MEKDLSTLWTNVLEDLEKKVSKASFVTFFKHTELLSWDDKIATIAAPSTMIVDLLQKRFQTDIKVSIEKHTKEEVTL